ncbi:MAG: hypothetical protein E2O52_01610, partial [Gammaproteobacteria bacterium]
MTKLRALDGALAGGALILMFGSVAHADQLNYTLTGTQSNVDNACVSPIAVFSAEDCSYNMSNPLNASGAWVGPSVSASYYLEGGSPFASGASPPPAPENPGTGKTELAISGTLSIED